MKTMKFLAGCAVAVMAVFSFCSCDNDDTYYYYPPMPDALVTVKPIEGAGFYMQLDDSTTMYPVNMNVAPYGDKEVRALVNYTDETRHGNRRYVHINWMDSIRTKMPADSRGEDNDSVYGNDPVEIVRDWVTIAEDGYLTLRIRTLWGRPGQTHVVNLLTGTNPDNPYELELRHDALGDTCGTMGDALIAFDLNRLVNQDSLSCVRVKLNWLSFSGRKSAEFSFRARPSDGTEGTEKPRGEFDNRMGAETGNDEAAILNSFLIR